MRPLDSLGWTDFGQGTTFQASKARLEFEVRSLIDNSRDPESAVNRIAIQKTRGHYITERDIRAFNREIRILHHFRVCQNIVRLLGIGWIYHQELETPIPQPEPVLMLGEATFTLRELVGPQSNLRPQPDIC